MLFPSSDTASALPSTNIPPLPKGLTCRWKRAWSSRWEPKIGIPGFGMVGVEDTFEVTEAGGCVLTRSTPEAEMIFLDV